MKRRIGQAAEKLEDAALEVQRVATVVEATSKTMSTRDPLRRYMDLIYAQVRETPFFWRFPLQHSPSSLASLSQVSL